MQELIKLPPSSKLEKVLLRMLVLLVPLILCSCGSHKPTPFPQWSSLPYIVNLPSNSFSEIQNEGVQAAEASGKLVYNIQFTPQDTKHLDAVLAPIITQLSLNLEKPCAFEFHPLDPFDVRKVNLGWAIIGRDLSWRIKNELAQQNGDQAIKDLIVGTRLGFLLTGGDADEAIIGDQIADGVRKAIMSNLPSLGASQLETVSSQMIVALALRPPRNITIQNETATLYQTVQSIQELFVEANFSRLSKLLASSSRAGMDAISRMDGQSRDAQIQFFQNLIDQAKLEKTWLESNGSLPSAKRDSPIKFKFTRKTPWISLAASLFTTGNSWLKVDDATLARTRLLAIYAQFESEVKTYKSAPKNLSQFAPKVRTDPYTGRSFFYVSQGANFLIYSAGENGLDDGGSTDPSFTTPDLFLENTR